MTFDKQHVQTILDDFVEDNPLACRGILSVATLEFTESVPTLAVTLRDNPPRLLINPQFVADHLRTEEDLRAVLLHEFLHVLLGHTKLFDRNDTATNIALDAVINHIVQRELGERAGGFFRRFYTPKDDECPMWLLRPYAPDDIRPQQPNNARVYDTSYGIQAEDIPACSVGAQCIHMTRYGLTKGTVLADDILDLFDALDLVFPGDLVFLGNHERKGDLHPANRARLERLFRELDGSGVFRRPGDYGIGAAPVSAEWKASDPSKPWRRTTAALLKKLIMPDPRSRPVFTADHPALLPVAHGGDRRAVLRSFWNPLLPDFHWTLERRKPGGLVNVYLDVSGSMNYELDLLTGLLWKLRHWIRMPVQAFSNGVAPAKFEDGRIVTQTTGGTCFNDVLRHIVEHRPGKSLIITDGYIEALCPRLLNQIEVHRQEIHVLVSSIGTCVPFDHNRIPRTQLPVHPSRVNR